MKDKFIEAIENNDIDEMRKIPKSDLHNHITRGGKHLIPLRREAQCWKY